MVSKGKKKLPTTLVCLMHSSQCCTHKHNLTEVCWVLGSPSLICCKTSSSLLPDILAYAENQCVSHKINRYIFLLVLSFSYSSVCLESQFLCGPLCPPAVGPLFSLLTVTCVIRQSQTGEFTLQHQSITELYFVAHTRTHTDLHAHKHNFSMLTKLIGKHSCARSHWNTSKTHCSNWNTNIYMGN